MPFLEGGRAAAAGSSSSLSTAAIGQKVSAAKIFVVLAQKSSASTRFVSQLSCATVFRAAQNSARPLTNRGRTAQHFACTVLRAFAGLKRNYALATEYVIPDTCLDNPALHHVGRAIVAAKVGQR
jgi:hypothetical protein